MSEMADQPLHIVSSRGHPDIIAKLESATRPDRELDCMIAVSAGGFYACIPQRHDRAPRYGYTDETGTRVEPGQAGDMLVPAYTASLDAALALVGERLPGWTWQITSPHPEMTQCYLCNLIALGYDDEESDTFQHAYKAYAATAPLAVMAALFRALDAEPV